MGGPFSAARRRSVAGQKIALGRLHQHRTLTVVVSDTTLAIELGDGEVKVVRRTNNQPVRSNKGQRPRIATSVSQTTRVQPTQDDSGGSSSTQHESSSHVAGPLGSMAIPPMRARGVTSGCPIWTLGR